MKIFFCFLKLLFLILFLSCKSPSEQILIKSASLIDSCIKEPNHSYALYIPEHDSACNNLPILIVLDPHGSGNSVINNFRLVSEKYKIIVAASNLIRNNYSNYISSINFLIADIKTKYKSSNQVYLCGFSGGARMAISYAQSNKIEGIMACGALASIKELDACRTNIYSIMGMTDFNFPEIAEFILNPDLKPNFLALEIAGDIHQWPDSIVLSRGVGYLINKSALKAEKCHYPEVNHKEIENNFLHLAENLKMKKEFIKSKLIYNNLLELKTLSNSKTIQKKLDSLVNCNDYISEFNQFTKSLQFEMKLREAYYNAMVNKDANWWYMEINNLNHQIEITNDAYELLVYKRTRAYLGILCYSLSRNSVLNNDLTLAEKIVNVYKQLEPLNADMYFFTAVLKLKKGKEKEAQALLDSARKYGFNDKFMIQQFFTVK